MAAACAFGDQTVGAPLSIAVLKARRQDLGKPSLAGVPPALAPARAGFGGPGMSPVRSLTAWWGPPGRSGQSSSDITILATCYQPILYEIADYIVDSPRDFVRFFGLASRSISLEIQEKVNSLWRQLYARTWPAFYDYVSFLTVHEDWRGLFQETVAGRLECLLEVFDREKMPGFTMAAMSAWVRYSALSGGFLARYLSASEVQPEIIPRAEGFRLRFCPASVCSRLLPGLAADGAAPSCGGCAASPRARLGGLGGAEAPRFPGRALLRPAWPGEAQSEEAQELQNTTYPYRVLEGFDGLVVGRGVELQWKMQLGSPFGWWYGRLEALRVDEDHRLATALITFPHFPSNARWHRVEVRFGDAEMRLCPFGGYSGGLRGVSEEDERRWEVFLPKEPLQSLR